MMFWEGVFFILLIVWCIWLVGYPIYYFSSKPRGKFDWIYYAVVLSTLALLANLINI